MMGIVGQLALRSTCPRARVGCVMTDEQGFILSTGYNGSPRGLAHCDDVGCLVIDNHCMRAAHAEQNAIVTAARNGVSVNNSTVYLTMQPCLRCLLMMVQSGVAKIVYGRSYDNQDPEHLFNFARSAGVILRSYEEELWH